MGDLHYDWPGNVRELENVIEREIILNWAGPLAFSHLSRNEGSRHEPDGALDFQALSLDEMNTHHIHRALEKTQGRISGDRGAARLLRINPSTLRSRMKKLGIYYSKKRTSSR
jgi:hydrogenase-4 transcriptional activator